VVTLTDRMDYLSNLGNNLAYCLSVEKLLQLEIPARAQWIRVMLTEIRGSTATWSGWGRTVWILARCRCSFYCFREREDILRIFEFFSGQRLMTSYIRVGGLAVEPPRGWEKVVGNFISQLPSKIDEYEGLLTENPIFLKRAKQVGHLPVERLLELGVTGPMIRAAGVQWDIRKSEPYSSYEKFDFNIPVQQDGDVFARFRVRMDEMRESIKIVNQCLAGMPGGPIRADAPKVVLPDREKMKTQMEALIYHFKIVTEGSACRPAKRMCRWNRRAAKSASMW
jgi:NADH-quinone oxidoreductase subunit D